MVWFGLEAEEYDRKYTDKELMIRILDYFKLHKKKMVIVTIFILLASISNGIIPYFTSKILASLEDGLDFSAITFGIVLIFILNTFVWVFNWINQYYSARVLNHVIYDLRTDVNNNVLIQDMSFFDKYPTGKIVSRVNSDTQSFGEMALLFIQSISALLAVFILFVPMFSIDFRLTSVLLIMIPLIFIFTLSFRKVARKKTLLGQRALASVNSFVQETMAGIQIAKTFRQEEKLYDEFKKINKQCFKVNFNRAMYMNLIFPGLSIIQGVTFACLIYFGGDSILFGSLQGADLYLFIQSLWNLFFPLFQIAAFWPQFQTGMAAAERTFALIDSKPAVIQKEEFVFEKLDGHLQFEDMSFYYEPEKPIFQNFNLDIKPGESIAIVGHTGAGKSSLARLLLRFYEFQKGNIIVDGKNIRDISLKEYRRFIGMIPQSPFLWADTLENNVKYGSPNATRENVIWALEQAGGADWVNDLVDGLDTNIRERGKLLSMGQRQLVVFARVLLQNPSILILDEATASVDPFTETKIQEAMEHLMRGRTSIIIAHRLRTVRHVDRIIVLDHGTIVEEGNHDTLMQKGGHYSNLYNTYFKHQSYDFIQKIENWDEDPAIDETV
ncbi:Vitamin B12 import ATP-binding protein BtuD [Candidatus Lokiarchaeum ossiferum]|uniref:Vitamin B12 import ATP-binding protein BtuD n=1 Tax=Candidatus Lokiarchaeum ossiferum TaxID=2951803 RepID=A0ABY6HKQ6_9ARCH|nr:Vitamin B12 import ATP-binding protein BtuD [Candidatus Lokiarchaeum sp. B-35]